MKRDMDEILKQALSPEDEPDRRLNQKILYGAEEMTHMAKMRYRRIPAGILAAAFTLLIGSTAVFAAWKYLSPEQVAEKLQDGKLTEAFQGADAVAVNETQESGGYRVTLLGAVAGKNISEYLSADQQGEVQDDRFYAAVAIEHTDGTPMPDTSEDAYGEESFFVSPYIEGLDPVWYNAITFGGGYSEFVQDGIRYRLLDVNNIEVFADRNIYIGVNADGFPDNRAFHFEESTGAITRNESYDGLNALFRLPLDSSKADPEAAQELLEHIWEDEPEGDFPVEQTDMELETFMEKVTGENLDDYAEVIESTVQVCTPNADGEFYYSWETEGGAGTENAVGYMDVSFPDRRPGTRVINGYSYSEGFEDLCIETHTLNADGTVTVAVYRPKNR